MTNKTELILRDYPELKKYLKGLPEDIWDLLIPTDNNEFKDFISEIKNCRANEETKNYIIRVQKRFDLPFRPNETILEILKKVRLKTLRDKINHEKKWK